jgi:hypothetical protein
MRICFSVSVGIMLAATCFGSTIWDDDFRHEDYEEEAGATFMVLLYPADRVYGVAFGSATWLKNTPVCGDYFIDILSNGVEDEWYAGLGMTLRLMPHWTVAPFAGIGGAYHHSAGENDPQPPADGTADGEPPDRGDSYWSWHFEGGVRWWTGGAIQLVELMGRQTMPNLEGDRDYWTIGISTGTGF